MREWIEIRDGKRYRVTRLPNKARVTKQRRDPGRNPYPPAKYPFAALINGQPRVYEAAPR